MAYEGDTGVFRALDPDQAAIPDQNAQSNSGTTHSTLGTDPSAGLAALNAFYTPAPATATSQRRQTTDTVSLAIGLVLLGGATIWTISQGTIILGIVLAAFLAFGIVLLVTGLKPKQGQDVPQAKALDYLERTGQLDEACSDFPLDPTVPDDTLRLGNRFVFVKSFARTYRYTDFTRIYVKHAQVNDQVVFLTLTADTADGNAHELCRLSADDRGKALASDLIDFIVRGNPLIRIG